MLFSNCCAYGHENKNRNCRQLSRKFEVVSMKQLELGLCTCPLWESITKNKVILTREAQLSKKLL